MTKIIEKNGFRIVTYNAQTYYVLLTDENIDSGSAFMKKNEFTGIQLNSVSGFRKDNVDFLKDYSFVEDIMMVTATKLDIGGLQFLENLKSLSINRPVVGDLDFNEFPALQSCIINWNKKLIGLENCKSLRNLTLHGYLKPDLSDLTNLKELRSLAIISSTIHTIAGIDTFQDLQNLDLSYNRNLTSLAGLGLLSNTLKSFEVQACKKINSIDEITNLSQLTQLGINNCGEIASIKPINNLKKLKRLDFWESTNVLDGDMTPCLGIEKVAFQNRKHYNYTNEQIDIINAAKLS
ncbi:MAG TPA: hypothetical protein VKB19_04280 [Pedobacter sp.]|nr:hypothetical protein [Pedobacter sp.]